MSDFALSHQQVDFAQGQFIRWWSIHQQWTPERSMTQPEVTKSCLLTWLLMGNDPLPVPPPVMHAAPNHAMIRDGQGIGCCQYHQISSVVEEELLFVCGHPWRKVGDYYQRLYRDQSGEHQAVEGERWTITQTGEYRVELKREP